MACRVEESLKQHIQALEKDGVSKDSLINGVSSLLEATISKAPRIKIYKIPSPSSCTHEVCICIFYLPLNKVAYPPDIPFKMLEPYQGPQIIQFDFKLDPFQEQAILCIENNQSVMVSAHTSAGKTVVAE